MPLNSAVYEPSRDRIYAVRDNWVFELSASTGAKVSESRFTNVGIANDSYIDYDSTTDRLWATYWRHTNIDTVFAEAYLASINPADITSVTLYKCSTGTMALPGGVNAPFQGPNEIITRGGIGWMPYVTADSRGNTIARINLATPTVTTTTPADSFSWGGIYHDGTFLFSAGNEFAGNNASGHNPTTLAAVVNVGNTGTRSLYGITRNPGGDCYMATSSQYVVKGTVSAGAPTASEIDLGRANANPHNIRYNSNDGLIYIPLYRDDTVAVLNPADDSFVIKTGFTNPWDCVFTPTRKFAVQHSSIGLKEIT